MLLAVVVAVLCSIIIGMRGIICLIFSNCIHMKLTIVRLLVATLHVGMTGFRDGGYTQLAQYTLHPIKKPATLNGTIFAGSKYHSLTIS